MSEIVWLMDQQARRIDPYLGFHRLLNTDKHDWDTIEVFFDEGRYYWTYVNEFGEWREAVEGPFSTAKEAYHDAT